jgi:phospholipase/lecithinase/hemolysin
MPGFENVAQGCCGTGLIELSFLCVLDEPLTCEDTDKYVFFDSAHQTERVYKMEASEMLNTSLAVFL